VVYRTGEKMLKHPSKSSPWERQTSQADRIYACATWQNPVEDSASREVASGQVGQGGTFDRCLSVYQCPELVTDRVPGETGKDALLRFQPPTLPGRSRSPEFLKHPAIIVMLQ
jgi:hypothetical protein